MIDSQAALDAAVEALGREPALALDTETDSFFAYKPRICLLQLSAPGRDLLVDPLAGLDLSGLGALLRDPARQVVLHAAENDVILMHHEFSWRIGNLFDTQVAAFVLGLKPYSLAGILEARFGVQLDKGLQRSDWARRPLSEEQMFYAREDTRHLLDLAADLRARAEEAGRTEEIEAECRRIAGRDWTPEPFDPEGFRKMAGARELDATGLRILSDLFLFRNAEAERRNQAAFRIVADSVLVAIARGRVTAPRKGVPESFWRRHGERVARIVREAPGKGPVPRREAPRGRREPVPPAVERRFEALRRWRARAAAERGVEPWVVARNELLSQVAQAGCRDLDGLRPLLEPFRFREYGEAMLAALLASDARPPENA
jgi:ribonuclease D